MSGGRSSGAEGATVLRAGVFGLNGVFASSGRPQFFSASHVIYWPMAYNFSGPTISIIIICPWDWPLRVQGAYAPKENFLKPDCYGNNSLLRHNYIPPHKRQNLVETQTPAKNRL